MSRYSSSEKFLQRAVRTIPLGSQTFSKSKTSIPYGVSPFFAERASGSKMWDVDGNEYLDFVSGLACVTLGYCDPDIDLAVQEQMKNGVTFSLPHRLEMEVAEMIVEVVPCAEKVRFAKTGSDATSGAIRVARGYTGRDMIAVCGYHSWQDWYIGSTTRDMGVPDCVKELTHKFVYNDIDSLKYLMDKFPTKFAAVILEPMNLVFPQDDFLGEVKKLCHEHGALLIFDETITGFRCSIGGAQKEFGITPDLATFGKGLANGYPLSALVGKARYMDIVEDIFFSGTFGGETLSLAAAKAVLTKLQKEPVFDTIRKNGNEILEKVQHLISNFELDNVLAISGHPSISYLQFKDYSEYTKWDVKTFFLQEVFKRGIYTLGTHNLSYAHNASDIDALLICYQEVFSLIKKYIDNGKLKENLECEVLIPLFSVR